MSPETRAQLTLTAAPNAVPAAWLRNLGVVLAGSAFVALCAHVTLPLSFTPVPLTMQPFAVLVLGLLLAPRLAMGTLLAYLAEGAAGLPVFTPGMSGWLHLVGPTAGYLISYPAAAFLISWMWRARSRSFGQALLSAAAGNLLILGFGALWLTLLTHASPQGVLAQAVVPFLPGDALKVVAAAGLAAGWNRLRRSSSPTV